MGMKKREKFVRGEIYHICNKSIANFSILQNPKNCQRFIGTFDYYNNKYVVKSYSYFLSKTPNYQILNLLIPKSFSYVKFLAYCLMPDHYHLLVKITTENLLSKYLGNIENSFSRYFNIKSNRKGPLWQSRFRAIRIKNNEQLLHITRYIHLNPTTSNLVEKPEDWIYSSYRDYIRNSKILDEILFEISIHDCKTYQEFVNSRIDYQKKLKYIKNLLLE